MLVHWQTLSSSQVCKGICKSAWYLEKLANSSDVRLPDDAACFLSYTRELADRGRHLTITYQKSKLLD